MNTVMTYIYMMCLFLYINKPLETMDVVMMLCGLGIKFEINYEIP